MPYIESSGDSKKVIFNPSKPIEFVNASPSRHFLARRATYKSRHKRYRAKWKAGGLKLKHYPGKHQFEYTENRGGKTFSVTFNGGQGVKRPWQLLSTTGPDGSVTRVAHRSGTNISELQRQIAGATTKSFQSMSYTFTAGGKIATALYRIGNSSHGPWINVRRTVFDYYGPGDANGGVNDLKSASHQQLVNGSWRTTAINYYRYYITGSSSGFAHALKIDLGVEGYRRAFNDGIDLETASDSTLKPYADHYFEYDPITREVTLEIAAVCSTCVGGGTSTDILQYFPRADARPNGLNIWSNKTVQTLPNGAQQTVYTNYACQPILKVYDDGTPSHNQWYWFWRYDEAARVIVEAMPASITTFSEAIDDLVGWENGTHFNPSSGLIKLTEYCDPSKHQGQVRQRNVIEGRFANNFVILSQYVYGEHTDNNGNTVSVLSQQADVFGVGGETASTFWSYTYYSGTNRVATRVTTLPVVSSAENGSDVSPTITEEFDVNGNLTLRTDERGVVSKFYYDLHLGVVSQQVVNYLPGSSGPGINATTDFTYDNFGRLIQTAGPSHSVLIGGSATAIRRVTWNVYKSSVKPTSGQWEPDQTWTGSGYLDTATSQYQLIDPVAIERSDKDGREIDQIVSVRSTGSGALSPNNTFRQTDWKYWRSTQYDNQHRTTSTRSYFKIPTSGTGAAGTNYAETVYGYDILERRNRIVTPDGTITRMVWAPPQRVESIWVGTNDTGATDSNPAGTGSPNNMVVVTENVYDGGSPGGDGNLTQQTQYVSSTSGDTRVISYGYDFRDRQITITDAILRYTTFELDNLGRTIASQSFDSLGGKCYALSETSFDARGHIYQTLTYAVDPSSGSLGHALISNTWYDPSGNVIQQIREGDGQVFTKSTYNGLGWVTAVYRGYNTGGTSYAQANTISNDVILAQTTSSYDEAGNVISQAVLDRLNDTPASGTGSTGSLSSGSNPKARASYKATWYDGIDRAIVAASYGAVSSFVRPSTPPAPSDTVLVSSLTYDNGGRVSQTIDPAGIVTETNYDDAARVIQIVEDSGSGRLNRTTNTTYTLDGQIETLTAVNATTGNQTTSYAYGTTLASSSVARNNLLASITYPDSVSGSDQVVYSYNRLAEERTVMDQRGTVRTIYYDKLGRPTNDCVTSNGTGTDVVVKQVATTYDIRGLTQQVTSYDSAAQNSGTILNAVSMSYNTFGQLVNERQSHAGNVGGASPNVQYDYDSGASSSNQIRPESLTYPNGRVITFNYGTSGGMNDRLNRLETIQDTTSGTIDLASYSYLGIGTVVQINYSQPSTLLDLWGGTSGTYAGLDLFNRIIDQRWRT